VSGAEAQPIGVLVMAHGTPASPAGIEPFYTAIRRGRPPPPELLAELVGRYDAIGGTSPLTERTRAQVAGVAAALEADAPGRYLVGYGAKFVSPNIEEAVAELTGAGVSRMVGIVLTPHQSSLGSGEYFRRATEAAGSAEPPVALAPIPSWHRADGFAPLLAARTEAALASVGIGKDRRTAVFFTAHSLPERALGADDPYPVQVAESASDVAGLLRLDRVPGLTWGMAWQSAGRTADPWIGPDLLSEIRRVADEGATSVVVCPVGFVSDHLEVLYDLDVEASRLARSLGVTFTRTRSLDDDPRFCSILAAVVRGAAEQDSAGAVAAVSEPTPRA
jgi:ferrochelatase